MVDVTIYIAFVAGLVSFLAPCILPIVPGFLAYLAGSMTDKPSSGERLQIFLNSVFFVIGFSLVFAIFGVLLNTVLNTVAYAVQEWLARIGGVIVIFFGLYLAGLVRIPYLDRDHKMSVKYKFGSKYLTSLAFGAAFAAGWTPCVGAALGAILGLAASHPGTAFTLLMAYSLGLGVPFLIVGAFASQASVLIARLGHTLVYINRAFGVILIILGVLVFTQSLSLIANFDLLNSILLK